jgi:hypothetical protein
MANTTTPAERRQSGAQYAAAVSQWLVSAPGRRSAQRDLTAADVDALLGQSDALRVTAETGLTAGDPLETAAAEVQLLAGAALDLLMAGRLAGPEPGKRSLAPEERADAMSTLPTLNELAELRAIVEAPQAYLVGAAALQASTGRRTLALADARAGRAGDRTAARGACRTGCHQRQRRNDRHRARRRHVSHRLQHAPHGAGMVGSDLTKELGADLVRAGGRVLDFVLVANEKILALTGLNAVAEAQKATQKALGGWLEQLQNGAAFSKLAKRVLGTKAIETEIGGWLAAYEGSGEALSAAQDQVSRLAGQYAAKARVVQKVNAGLSLVKLAPPVRTPVGSAALAVVYLGLLTYTLGSAYDHVDSDRIGLLDRVEGVRGVMQRALVQVSPPGPSANSGSR